MSPADALAGFIVFLFVCGVILVRAVRLWVDE